MNRKTIISLLVLIIISSLVYACDEAQPTFEVLSLNITPPTITTGEKATIKVKIRNNDAEGATYNVPLMVNGVADDRRSVTLAPGEIETLTFILTRSHHGTYTVSVGNQESKLVVEKPSPAEFQLSDLEIDPAEIDIGDNIIVTAKIANIGGTQGSYTAELKIDGTTVETEQLTIPAGTDRTLAFKMCECLPGDYTVTLGSLTGQFVVREPFNPIIDWPTSTPTPTPTNPGCRTRG